MQKSFRLKVLSAKRQKKVNNISTNITILLTKKRTYFVNKSLKFVN